MKASKREPKLDNKSANQEQIFGNDKKNNKKDCRPDTKIKKKSNDCDSKSNESEKQNYSSNTSEEKGINSETTNFKSHNSLLNQVCMNSEMIEELHKTEDTFSKANEIEVSDSTMQARDGIEGDEAHTANDSVIDKTVNKETEYNEEDMASGEEYENKKKSEQDYCNDGSKYEGEGDLDHQNNNGDHETDEHFLRENENHKNDNMEGKKEIQDNQDDKNKQENDGCEVESKTEINCKENDEDEAFSQSENEGKIKNDSDELTKVENKIDQESFEEEKVISLKSQEELPKSTQIPTFNIETDLLPKILSCITSTLSEFLSPLLSSEPTQQLQSLSNSISSHITSQISSANSSVTSQITSLNQLCNIISSDSSSCNSQLQSLISTFSLPKDSKSQHFGQFAAAEFAFLKEQNKSILKEIKEQCAKAEKEREIARNSEKIQIEQRAKLEGRIEQMQRELEVRENKIKNFEESCKIKDKTLEVYHREVESSKRESKKIRKDNELLTEKLETESKNNRKLISEKKDLENKCKEIEENLKLSEKDNYDLNKSIQRISEENSSLNNSLKSKNDEVEKLNDEIKKYKSNEAEFYDVGISCIRDKIIDLLSKDVPPSELKKILNTFLKLSNKFDDKNDFNLIDKVTESFNKLDRKDIGEQGVKSNSKTKSDIVDFLYRFKDKFPFSKSNFDGELDVFNKIMEFLLENNLEPSKDLKAMYSQCNVNKCLTLPDFETVHEHTGMDKVTYELVAQKFNNNFVYCFDNNKLEICKYEDTKKGGVKLLSIGHCDKVSESMIGAGLVISSEGDVKQGYFKYNQPFQVKKNMEIDISSSCSELSRSEAQSNKVTDKVKNNANNSITNNKSGDQHFKPTKNGKKRK